MTIRNLDALFAPRSIALVGASRRAGSVGAVLARNLFAGGFDGPIMPVNPRGGAIGSVLAYRDVASLPEPPDLAIVATPPDTVPGLIGALGARGCRAAVVVTAGFGAGDPAAARALSQAMLAAAQPHLLRIVGPNCIGVMAPGHGVNASFAHVPPHRGALAFVTQSGAVATAVLDWASARDIGFSHLVSLGDMADVDFGDLLDYLALEPETHAILLYIEAVTQARKFMSAARAAARNKPVIVIKAGRHAAAAQAATSHAGGLAGADDVYDAAFRRAGMLRVAGLAELFAAVETLAHLRPPAGDRLAIVTNGGGIGVLAIDDLIDAGGRLAELAPQTVAALDAVLPPTWSGRNPVDIVIGDATAERYSAALGCVLGDPGVDAVLVINSPTGVGAPLAAADAVIALAHDQRQPVMAAWLGEYAAVEARHRFAAAGVPNYATPADAVAGFMDMVQYRRNQAQLLEAPQADPVEFVPDRAAAEAVVARAEGQPAHADGSTWLDQPSARALLTAYGIPVRRAAAAAGVEVGFAAAHRPGAHELIAGLTTDPTFGPVVLFGAGGVGVEVRDRALALPPLNTTLALELIARTRIAVSLRGHRHRPPADLPAIAQVLVRLARLAADLPAIAELEINPLLADDAGVIALDVRARIQDPAAAVPLAVLPYPNRLERDLALRDGTTVRLRPIRPEDAPAITDFFAHLSPEDVRSRFFVAMKALPPALLARLTQIDYDREMALVALARGAAGDAQDTICGVARLSTDPDNLRAEYAVVVRSDWKGHGLGYALMRAIIDYARERAIAEVFGVILAENAAMIEMARELGFAITANPEDASMVIARLPLGAPVKP